MNPRTTVWLIGLAVAAFAFIYFIEGRLREASQRAKEPKRLLAGFDPQAISSIEVARSNQVIRAERKDDGWYLTAPIYYPAQSGSIEHWLTTVGLIPRQPVLSASELLARTKAAAEFGIDPPQITLV